MTAKEYLGQVMEQDRRIEALLDRQRRYHELGAWRATTFSDEEGPRQMRALERELDARISAYGDLVRQIEAAINAVEDTQYRDVLRFRYLNGWSWQKIAERMHFCEDWIWKLHRRALKAVRMPE